MLKGARCYSAKCPMEKQSKNRPPGTHFWRRRKSTNYGVRLREKQKVKRYYGVFERQFARYFAKETLRRVFSVRNKAGLKNDPFNTPTSSIPHRIGEVFAYHMFSFVRTCS